MIQVFSQLITRLGLVLNLNLFLRILLKGRSIYLYYSLEVLS
jgi:hypothetical protein